MLYCALRYNTAPSPSPSKVLDAHPRLHARPTKLDPKCPGHKREKQEESQSPDRHKLAWNGKQVCGVELYIDINICRYACRYIQIYADVYIYIHRDILIYIDLYVDIYIYMGVYIYIDIYIDICRYIPICMYEYVDVYICRL